MVLRDLSTGRDVAPQPRFFVSYRFNALGFRGPDYAIPAPEGTFRILALGDSFTLGVGVHEEDTFAAQLESRLNAAAGVRGQPLRYEVINAGVGGYSTEQERLSYESFSSAYEPQVVLLTMVYNDDLAFADEVEARVRALIGRARRFVKSVGAAQQAAAARASVRLLFLRAGTALLDESCRRSGARLAVVIFRQSSWEPWLRLVDDVNEGVRGTDIPVLDLGPTLLPDRRFEELVVHPTDRHPNEIAHRLAAEEIRAISPSPGACFPR